MKQSRILISAVIFLGLLVGLFALSGCSSSSQVAVEIAYRNHPPVQAVLVDVDKLLVDYGEKVKVTRYDVDTPEGAAFLKSKNLTGSTVLAIFIDGSVAYQKGDQQVQFMSFPVGKGTAMTEAGNWILDDLDAALAIAANK